MCADDIERYALQDQSDALISRLAHVAKALILVEDRRADLLLEDALSAPSHRQAAIKAEAAYCRAVATAASDMFVKVGGGQFISHPARPIPATTPTADDRAGMADVVYLR